MSEGSSKETDSSGRDGGTLPCGQNGRDKSSEDSYLSRSYGRRFNQGVVTCNGKRNSSISGLLPQPEDLGLRTTIGHSRMGGTQQRYGRLWSRLTLLNQRSDRRERYKIWGKGNSATETARDRLYCRLHPVGRLTLSLRKERSCPCSSISSSLQKLEAIVKLIEWSTWVVEINSICG